MFVVMNSRITIGKLIFKNQLSSFEADLSWQNLTQTATVRIPRFTKIVDDVQYTIKVGDSITVELAYDDDFRTEYEGYVSEISLKSIIEIKCEDEMWLYKQQTVALSWPTIKLKNILMELFPEAELEQVPDITLSSFKLDRVSKYRALEKLKDEYGLVAYFRGKKLFCGLALTETGLGEVIYDFRRNIPKDETDKNLTFKNKEDLKIKVRAVSMLADNKKIEVELGDDDGEQRTLTYYNIKSKSELKTLATDQLDKLKFTGYRGSFNSFGRPFSMFGQVCVLRDEKYPERTGRYFIDRVKPRYDSSGYRREISPGRMAAG